MPVVRFEGLRSSSSLENTVESVKITPEKISMSPVVNLENSSIQLNSSSKNTSTEDEVFYSPNASFEENVDKEKTPPEISKINEEIAVDEDKSVALEGSVYNDTEETQEIAEDRLKPRI